MYEAFRATTMTEALVDLNQVCEAEHSWLLVESVRGHSHQ
jgi:hypothetical protein